jgi:thiamine-monophosphate kinase
VTIDELSIIDRFFRPLAGEGSFALNDDAGSLTAPAGFEIVVTTDMIASGVHFLPGDPADSVAQKALRVNISDLAAKGAKPFAYVLGLGLGDETGESWLAEFAEGLRRDQQTFSMTLLGGDTISVGAGPVISITAFGLSPAKRMVHRFGAKPGDALYVSGEIGAAAAGLALLKSEPGPWDTLYEKARDTLVRRFRVPEPRTRLSPALLEFASAAMDVSDGLVGDCDKLSAASGCSAVIDARAVPLPAALDIHDETLLARLLTAGDDYEILAAVPPRNEAGFRTAAAQAHVAVARIGFLQAGGGLTKVLVEGRPLSLFRRAYMHRAGEEAR